MGQSASSQYLFDNTMTEVDFKRYSGLWYEVARLPFFWENKCSYSTARYHWNEKTNSLRVKNTCHSRDGSVSSRYANAWVHDPLYPGVLDIEFNDGGFSWGKSYYLLHYTDYENVAVVGSANKSYLWILSRNRDLNPTIFRQAIKLAIKLGYDLDELIINRI